MAQVALLEREYTPSAEDEENTAEAIAHRKRSAEIYNDVFQTRDPDTAKITEAFSMPSAPADTATIDPVREEIPLQRDHFSDYPYRDHSIGGTDVKNETAAAVYAPEVPASAPAQTSEPAAPEAKPETEENEDTRPTRRTMDTLQRDELYRRDFEIEPQQKEHVGFFASLSSKTKMALAIVSAVFVAVIAIVCINTGIINSMKSDVRRKQEELEKLSEYSESLNGQIEAVTDPAYVDDYAENVLGMTRS